jgi:hypothetical protein
MSAPRCEEAHGVSDARVALDPLGPPLEHLDGDVGRTSFQDGRSFPVRAPIEAVPIGLPVTPKSVRKLEDGAAKQFDRQAECGVVDGHDRPFGPMRRKLRAPVDRARRQSGHGPSCGARRVRGQDLRYREADAAAGRR